MIGIELLQPNKLPGEITRLLFFRPWSLAPQWDGQTEACDGIHSKRLLLPIMLKLSQRFFGTDPFPMYFLTKGLFFSGCVAIVFLLLIQVVPMLYAILGSLVFLLVPAHYSHVLWIADTVTMCYFFLFLGIGLFYALQKNILGRGSNKQFAWLLLSLFVTGWIGIKTKEPMLVLAIIVWIFSLLQFRTWKFATAKLLLLNASMVLVAFQIVPITNLSAGSVPSLQFKWDTLLRLLFQNHDCGYENETVSALFSWGHVFPISVARTLGFFALWAMIISIGHLAWQRWIRKERAIVQFWDHALVKICSVWLFAELPFLGMFQPDPRYFSGTMAPIIEGNIILGDLISKIISEICIVEVKSDFFKSRIFVALERAIKSSYIQIVFDCFSAKILQNYPRRFKKISHSPPDHNA